MPDAAAIFVAVFPVLTAFAGFWFNNHLSLQREERQRRYDDQRRRVIERRAKLDEFQRALGVTKQASSIAGHIAAKFDEEGDAGGADAGVEFVNSPWGQKWMDAEANIQVLAAQIDDADLTSIMQELDAQHLSSDDLREGEFSLEAIYKRANDRAGHLYRIADTGLNPLTVMQRRWFWHKTGDQRS